MNLHPPSPSAHRITGHLGFGDVPRLVPPLRSITVAGLVVAALVLAACQGGGPAIQDPSGSTTTTTSTPGSAVPTIGSTATTMGSDEMTPGDEGPQSTAAPGTRKAALHATVDRAVMAQSAVAESGAALATATAEWCDAGTGSLTSTADAWRATMGARQRQLALGTGPTSETTSMSLIDWPVDGEILDELLASDTPITTEGIANGPASRRGLLAIEAVLFDPGRVPSGPGDSTCEWLVAATNAVAQELAALHVAWIEEVDGTPAEQDRLRGIGRSGVTTQQAIDELVRSQVFTADDLVDSLLSGVLGESTMEHAGEGPGGSGAAQVAAVLDELAIVHDGDHLGSQYSQEVSERVTALIAAAQQALGDDTPLAERGADDVRVLRDAMEDVRTALRTDVSAELDVQVGFSDNDGDSG